MALYGVGLDVTVAKLNNSFKMQIKQRGGIGIKSIGRIFRRFDDNGNKKLDICEFEEALANCGLFPSKVELQALMKFYDVDNDGNITYEEFLRGLREELTERRQYMVGKAFALMDKDGSGQITVEDVKHLYDASQHKDFIEGTKTKEEVIEEFLDSFDGAKGNNDGIITKQEWNDYYTDLSMSTPSDDYFVQMMESVWGIMEDDDSAVNQDHIRELTKLIRERLLKMSNQSSDEYILRKLFNYFDTNESGNITIDELAAMLAKLQISVDRKYLNGIMRKVDQDNNGAIEFNEFLNYVIMDPYK
jgi:Ca2+-binding EF-hand superfamily protein